MSLPTKELPSIKFVKKAKQWCKTYFEYSEQTHQYKQIQEWSDDEPVISG